MTGDAVIVDLEGKMTECKEAGRNSGGVGAHFAFVSVARDEDVERGVALWRDGESAVRQLDERPVSTCVLINEFAHERVNGLLDREHVSPEVPREHLQSLVIRDFARLDGLRCRIDGDVHERRSMS